MSTMAMNPYLQQQMNQKAPVQNLNAAGLGLGPGLSGIMQQLQQTQNQANAANQQRYKDILGLYSGMGQAGAQEIAQQTAQAQGKSTQDLTSRGLGNTTITGVMSRGIAQAGQQNLLNLQESLAGKEAGAMESMTQKGPDMSMYGNLIQAAMSRPQQGAVIQPNWEQSQQDWMANLGQNM